MTITAPSAASTSPAASGADAGAAARAAEAFARALPSDRPLTAVRPAGPAGGAALALEASWLGETTVELRVEFAEEAVLAPGDGIGVENLVHPAFEAAGRVFGPGVLGEVRRAPDAGPADADDAAADGAHAFALLDGTAPAGRLAMRVRGPRAADAGGEAPAERLGRINGVEMALTVEIGRTRMTVREVLALEPGAVVELDRSAGAPADILLNGRVIAHGEVVVVDQDYAVRVTRILDAQEGAR